MKKFIMFCLCISLLTLTSHAAIVWTDIEINEWVTNSVGGTSEGSNIDLIDSVGEPVIDQSVGDQVAIQSGIFHDYYYIPPTATATFTPTIAPTLIPTATPLHGFDGKIIAKKYTYTAPNPVRGPYANFNVYVKEACTIEVNVYTTSNQFVMSFNMDCPGAGKYERQVHMANLANGVYLFLVKAKVNGAEKERLVKKIALIK